MDKEEKQHRLQEMLSAARGALEDALQFATEHDLWFEFTGIRRGPGEYDRTFDVSDRRSVAARERENEEEGGRWPRTQVDILDISEEWVGSWC